MKFSGKQYGLWGQQLSTVWSSAECLKVTNTNTSRMLKSDKNKYIQSGNTWNTNIEKIESADEQFEYKYRCASLQSYNACFLVSLVLWLYFFKSGLTSNVKATSNFSISAMCSDHCYWRHFHVHFPFWGCQVKCGSKIRIILLIPVRSEYVFKFLDVIKLFFAFAWRSLSETRVKGD